MSKPSFSRGAATVLAALTLLVVASRPAEAQRRAGQVVLHGNVVDSENGHPVWGAFVAGAEDRTGVLTDSLGRFSLPLDRAETYPIRVNQLGYLEFRATMPQQAESRAFTVGLKPDPVAIEGLTVLTDKLADRRRGPFGIVNLLDQKQLLKVPAGTGLELLHQIMPFVQPCSPDADTLCYNNQGRKQPIDVCIDGRQVPSDSPELDALNPHGLYLAEAYQRVGQVRYYTRGYIARLMANGQELPPMNFGCSGAMPGGPGGF